MASKQLKMNDGSFYDGETKQGLPHGKGKMVWQNGDIYEGMFKNNKRNGMGKRTNADGS